MEEDERRKRRQAVTLKLFLGAIVVSQHSRAVVLTDPAPTYGVTTCGLQCLKSAIFLDLIGDSHWDSRWLWSLTYRSQPQCQASANESTHTREKQLIDVD